MTQHKLSILFIVLITIDIFLNNNALQKNYSPPKKDIAW